MQKKCFLDGFEFPSFFLPLFHSPRDFFMGTGGPSSPFLLPLPRVYFWIYWLPWGGVPVIRGMQNSRRIIWLQQEKRGGGIFHLHCWKGKKIVPKTFLLVPLLPPPPLSLPHLCFVINGHAGKKNFFPPPLPLLLPVWVKRQFQGVFNPGLLGSYLTTKEGKEVYS